MNKRARRDERFRKLHREAKRDPRLKATISPDFDPKVHRMCLKKVRWSSEAAAVQRIRELNKDTPLYRYECRICAGWHITSKEPWSNAR